LDLGYILTKIVRLKKENVLIFFNWGKSFNLPTCDGSR